MIVGNDQHFAALMTDNGYYLANHDEDDHEKDIWIKKLPGGSIVGVSPRMDFTAFDITISMSDPWHLVIEYNKIRSAKIADFMDIESTMMLAYERILDER